MVGLYKIVQEEINELFARCHKIVIHYCIILVLVEFIQSEGNTIL